jgi:hypothetical protein
MRCGRIVLLALLGCVAVVQTYPLLGATLLHADGSDESPLDNSEMPVPFEEDDLENTHLNVTLILHSWAVLAPNCIPASTSYPTDKFHTKISQDQDLVLTLHKLLI